MTEQAQNPEEPARPPTIRDVAREAGVSKSLVSLVFNGGENVSEERRSRVLHAAELLGYRPNLVAQSLAAGRHELVAILVANLSNPVFADIVAAAKDRLCEAGQRALIVAAQAGEERDAAVLDGDNLAVLRDLRPAGLIAVGSIPDLAQLGELIAATPTVVASGIDATADTVAAVRTDDDAGIGLAVEHVAEQGCRRIAFVGGDGGTVSAARERAYRAAMARCGLGGFATVARADFTEAAAGRAVARMLAASEVPEAIVAVNDLCALGVIAALEQAGVPVPAGCLVTGYDNSALAAIPRISLTSVDPDNRRIGREAAAALLAASGPFRRGRELLIPPSLVVRASSRHRVDA